MLRSDLGITVGPLRDEVDRPRGPQAAPSEDSDMRRRAEEALDAFAATRDAAASRDPKDAAAALHELHMHPIELEMKNDELRRGQLDLLWRADEALYAATRGGGDAVAGSD